MKILFVGNSYSQDATTYIEAVAEGELFVRNLYIGGCSLDMHYKNLTSGEAAYEYQRDGVAIEKISLADALAREDWDVISLQQVSVKSGIAESYEPYIGTLIEYIRQSCPRAEVVLHRVWADCVSSRREGIAHYGYNSLRMYEMIVDATTRVAKKYRLRIIPTGDAVQLARYLPELDVEAGGVSIHRDGFHLSLDLGRYLASLVLYGFFTGESPCGVRFSPDGTDPVIVEKLKACADRALK